QFHLAGLHLADVYFQIGRYKDSLRQYEKYIQIAPSEHDRAVGYHRIFLLFFRKGDLEQAAAAAKKEFINDKSYVQSSFMIALERGDMPTAERLKNRVFSPLPYTQRGGRHPAILDYYRGCYALKTGNGPEAVKYFQEEVRHSVLWWNIHTVSDCLADAYFKLGDLDKAVNEYERILNLNPNWPLGHYHLAQVYERKGLQEKARAEYRTFLSAWKDADSDIPEFINANK